MAFFDTHWISCLYFVCTFEGCCSSRVSYQPRTSLLSFVGGARYPGQTSGVKFEVCSAGLVSKQAVPPFWVVVLGLPFKPTQKNGPRRKDKPDLRLNQGFPGILGIYASTEKALSLSICSRMCALVSSTELQLLRVSWDCNRGNAPKLQPQHPIYSI